MTREVVIHWRVKVGTFTADAACKVETSFGSSNEKSTRWAEVFVGCGCRVVLILVFLKAGGDG